MRPRRSGGRLPGITIAALSCALAGFAAASGGEQPPSASTAVPRHLESYRVRTGMLRAPAGHSHLVVLRSGAMEGRLHWFVVDPATLATSLVPAESAHLEPLDPASLRARLAGTRYGQGLDEGRQHQDRTVDAGVTHLHPTQPGINLTVDLCPSRHPLDRRLFLTLIDDLERVERPVPVAVAVTGVWMRDHPADLDWLVGLDRAGRLRVTWVNHTFNHFVSRTRPLAENFLLAPGTDVVEEVLATERALIARGLVPSVFFRFPGLVSSPALVETVASLGLIPVGSDAWLAKGQRPGVGSIVLVHGNGNEPLGVERFIALLRTEQEAVRQRRWLLLDLRDTFAGGERVP